MIVLGIDPGKSGAIAVNTGDSLTGAWIMPMNGKEYDVRRIVDILSATGARVVVVEEPPKQIRIGGKLFANGIASLWECFGIVQGMAEARGRQLIVVKPSIWRKAMLPGTAKSTYDERKAASITVAQRLFPGISLKPTERCKRNHDGMAEALLLSEYGRRQLASEES